MFALAIHYNFRSMLYSHLSFRYILLLVFPALFFVACGQNTTPDAAPTATDTSTVAPAINPAIDPNADFYQEKGLWIEKNPVARTDSSRNNVDNTIFLPDRIFAYTYTYTDSVGQQYYMTKDDDRINSSKNWIFVPTDRVDKETITEIWYTVERGLGKLKSVQPGLNKTAVRLNYVSPAGPTPLREWNGLIENSRNIWMYPPRNMAFAQLVFNPYPYVDLPLEAGRTWSWRTEVNARYSDERWRTFTGKPDPTFLYKAIGQEAITTPFGSLSCWRIEASGTSTVGTTSSIFYFHPQYGFVRIEHHTISNGLIVFTLKALGTAK